MKHRITKVVVTTEDGQEHTFEGNGSASVEASTVKDRHEKKQPSARISVVMPLAAEWATGDGGKYVKPALSTLS